MGIPYRPFVVAESWAETLAWPPSFAYQSKVASLRIRRKKPLVLWRALELELELELELMLMLLPFVIHSWQLCAFEAQLLFANPPLGAFPASGCCGSCLCKCTGPTPLYDKNQKAFQMSLFICCASQTPNLLSSFTRILGGLDVYILCVGTRTSRRSGSWAGRREGHGFEGQTKNGTFACIGRSQHKHKIQCWCCCLGLHLKFFLFLHTYTAFPPAFPMCV